MPMAEDAASRPVNRAEYMEMVVPKQCPMTIGGWVWYCDQHDTHGNADSADEASTIAAGHEEWWRISEGDGGLDICDIYVVKVDRDGR